MTFDWLKCSHFSKYDTQNIVNPNQIQYLSNFDQMAFFVRFLFAAVCTKSIYLSLSVLHVLVSILSLSHSLTHSVSVHLFVCLADWNLHSIRSLLGTVDSASNPSLSLGKNINTRFSNSNLKLIHIQLLWNCSCFASTNTVHSTSTAATLVYANRDNCNVYFSTKRQLDSFIYEWSPHLCFYLSFSFLFAV